VHDVDLKPFNEITFPRYFGQLGSSVQSLRLESCRSSTDTYLELLNHFARLEDLFVSDTSSTKDPGVVVELNGMSGINGSVQVRVDLDKATMPLWLSKIPWKVQEAAVAATSKSGKPFALDTLFASPTHNLQRLCIELSKPRASHRTVSQNSPSDPPSSFFFSSFFVGGIVESQPEKYTLAGCNDLQQIHFQMVTIKRPCDFLPLTLSTVDSAELNKVILDIVSGEVNCQRKFDADVDLSAWAPVDQALCVLAEKFGTGNPGVEFEVAVRVKGPKEVVRAVSGSKMFIGLRKRGAVAVSQL